MKELEKSKSSAKAPKAIMSKGTRIGSSNTTSGSDRAASVPPSWGARASVSVTPTSAAPALRRWHPPRRGGTRLGGGDSHLVGLLLGHRLVDVFVRLRFPEAATQQ